MTGPHDAYLEEIDGDDIESGVVDGAYIEQDGDDIVVDFSGKAPSNENEDDGEHDENLAAKLDPTERVKIGMDVCEWVREDESSRAQWKKRLMEGLQIIGVEEIPSEHGAFDGSATVNHPAIAEAMVRFQANAMEELFPAEGPVKTVVIGKSTDEREEQSMRVSEFMNYQLCEDDDEYFEHTDQMTMYLPFSGSAFKKVHFDMTLGESQSRFVTAENFIVPYDATSLKSCPRYTHKYKLYGNEINAKINSGEFIPTDSLDPSGTSDATGGVGLSEMDLEDVSDQRESFRADEDVVYDIFECHAEMVFEQFDQPDKVKGKHPVALPYVITVEKDSGEVLAIRRLWKEDDPKKRKRVHFIHYKFLPGLGFYGWGYLHIIGSLGKAASGALRALLDGSATASLQGGFKSKESKVAGEFVFTPGVWQDIDMTAEDLAKSFYTPPFKEPSPALFKTLELLVNGIQAFSSTTEAMTGAGDNKGPVGTTLALIEQGSKVYSGIHKRMHKAARFEFKLLAQLNYEHMDDEYPYDVNGGDRSIFKSDFDGRVDILPVSDPNIYSNVQRVAQAQAVLELVKSDPDLYDERARRKAHLFMHKALRTPDAESYLPKRRTTRLDPVTENQIMLTGGAVEAFAEQDHQSHIQGHRMFLQEVMGMGLDPQIVQAVTLNINAHVAEHFAHAYRLRIEQELQRPMPAMDFKEGSELEDMDIMVDSDIARSVAENIAPPPPPQGPEPSEEEQRLAEHEQEMKLKEQAHQQSMKHKQEDHDADLQRSAKKNEQDMKLSDQKNQQAIKHQSGKQVLETAAQASKLASE